MSSATSTDASPLTSNQTTPRGNDSSLAPWQFFTLAGLIGATIVVFLSEGQTPAAIILLSCVVFGAAAVGATAWRTFAPLVGEEAPTGPQMLGGRTRAALEREKTLVLRSIKDLEFDRAMGKVSDKDFTEMGARLRGRAAGLLRQLDAGSGYRDAIQHELDRRLRPYDGHPQVRRSSSFSGCRADCRHHLNSGHKVVRVLLYAERCRRPVLQELRVSTGGPVTRLQRLTTFAGALMLVLAFTGSAGAQIQMPDPSLIHGKAIPARDLQTGTITVRIVREAIGNNVSGRQVTMTIGGVARTATTDEIGRAEFRGLPAGGQGRAEANVDGEQLVSDPIVVPNSGGLRVILVAGLAKAVERRKQEESQAAAAPPVRGSVFFGGNSRIVFEYPNDLMRVYYLLEIVNNARTRVDIGGPVVIDLPSEALGVFALQGSTPQLTISGARLTVTGPFASGITPVQVGFQLPFTSATRTIEQKWPAPIEQITVASQKVGALTISSPQFSTVGDIKSEDGTTFLLASGGALPAGGLLTVDISGLPVHSTTSRNVALGLAALIGVTGLWLAWPGASNARESRSRLMARRDSLLGELAKLEERLRAGANESPKDLTRKQRLVTELEQIYGELDEASPRGGGEGLAA